MMTSRRLLRILQAIGYELLPVHPTYAMEQTKCFLTNLSIFWSFVVKSSILLSESLWNLVVQLKWRSWLMMVVWGLCLLLFWYLEFGSVFMLGTGFALIFANLGDTRREGDMSAWSVFNQGFTTMLGTLSAEQMDREIRHRNLHDNDDDD